MLVDTLWEDFRHAVRTVTRAPWLIFFTASVLALGLGTSVGVFSIVNAVLLRPLPARSPNELRYLTATDMRGSAGSATVTFRDYDRLAEGGRAAFVGMLARCEDRATARFGNLAGTVLGESVSPNYLELLGVSPALGRGFDAQDTQSSAAPVVVISHELWALRFGLRPDVLGRTLEIDASGFVGRYGRFRSYVIIGVMGRDFRGTLGPWRRARYWVLWSQRVRDYAKDEPDYEASAGVLVIGRLRSQGGDRQASALVRSLGIGIQREFHPFEPDWRPVLGRSYRGLNPFDPGGQVTSGPFAAGLLLVCGMVLLTTLINLVGALAGHAAARRMERAVRLVLGATRWDLARQGVAEGLTIAAVGGCGALLVGRCIVSGFLLALPNEAGRYDVVSLSVKISTDARVLLFAVALSVASGLILGLVSAYGSSGVPLASVVARGGAGMIGRVNPKVLRPIVIAQVGLCLALTVVAVGYTGALVEAEWADRGYQSDGVVTMQLLLPEAEDKQNKDGTADPRLSRLQGALERANASALQAAVALTDAPPWIWILADAVAPNRLQPVRVSTSNVSARYFSVLQIPVLRGRGFESRDSLSPTTVVIVSESLARELWGTSDPLAQRLAFTSTRSALQPVWRSVVGVVGDLAIPGADLLSRRVVYTPIGELTALPNFVLARGHGSASALLAGVADVMTGSEPTLIVERPTTLRERLAGLLYVRRVSTALIASTAFLTVCLAVAGVYGLVAFSVALRLGEIGLRRALGASHADIAHFVMREGLRIALWGVALSIPLTAGAVALSSRLIGEAPAIGPFAVGAIPSVVVGLVLLACLPSAWHAATVEPSDILHAR